MFNSTSWIWLTLFNVVANGTVIFLFKSQIAKTKKSYASVIFVAFIVALAIYFPYFWLQFQKDWLIFTQPIGWLFYFLGLSISVAAYYFYIRAVSGNDLSIIGPLDNLRPLFVVPLSVLLLKTIPSLKMLLGMVLITIGAFLIQQQKTISATFRYLLKKPQSQLILASTALFAVLGIIDKITLRYTTPAKYAFIGMLGMAVVYGVAYFVERNRLSLRLVVSLPLIICGVLIACGTLSIMSALALSTPLQVIPLQMTRSFYLAILGFVFLRERGLVRKLLAGSVMFVGVLFLIR